MAAEVADFTKKCNQFIQEKNGERLSKLISFSSSLTSSRTLSSSAFSVGVSGITMSCNQHIPEPFTEVILQTLLCRLKINEDDYVSAFNHQHSALTKLLEFAKSESNWIIPLLHTLSYDTKVIATEADIQQSSKANVEIHDNLRHAEQLLKRLFSLMATDRAPISESKKWGSLYLVNLLFKIYFKLNTVRLCRNLIRIVEANTFPDFEKFAKRDTVTYKFYVGCLSMFEDQYDKAEEALDYSFRHCHKDYTANSRRVLQYLIPVKLLMGRIPSNSLLWQYNLEEFVGITNALRAGNLKDFNNYLELYQEVFIRKGTYLVVEKLKMVVLRNLFKKIYLILNKHQLKISYFEDALKFLGVFPEEDETECMLANLIFKNYVKGYISHEKKVLVLSKKKPFPPIVEVFGS